MILSTLFNLQTDVTESEETTIRWVISLMIVIVANEALLWICNLNDWTQLNCFTNEGNLQTIWKCTSVKDIFHYQLYIPRVVFHLKYNFCLMLGILQGNVFTNGTQIVFG